MMYPHTELRFIDESMGYGVFATRRIPRGSITWARCDLDQTFDPEHVKGLPLIYRDLIDKYSFMDSHGQLVLCWDHGRYVNHSCRPSCMSPGYDFEIAVRDIEVGEELTDDYGTLNLEWSFECRCGNPDCRGKIRPDDLLTQGDRWDAQVQEAFPLIGSVEQPLWELVQEKDSVKDALDGRIEIPSCKLNYIGLRGAENPYRFAPRSLSAS